MATAQEVGNGGGGGGGAGGVGGRTSLLLHHPDDALFLNELFCFVRHQVEAFVVVPPQSKNVDGGTTAVVAGGPEAGPRPPGTVGIRCAHCFSSERLENKFALVRRRAKGTIFFPSSTRLVCQSVRNWLRRHLPTCPCVPEEVRVKIDRLKANGSRSTKEATRYWEESCRRMGMVDTPQGIQLKDGEQLFSENYEREGTVLSKMNSSDAAPTSCGNRPGQLINSSVASLDTVPEDSSRGVQIHSPVACLTAEEKSTAAASLRRGAGPLVKEFDDSCNFIFAVYDTDQVACSGGSNQPELEPINRTTDLGEGDITFDKSLDELLGGPGEDEKGSKDVHSSGFPLDDGGDASPERSMVEIFNKTGGDDDSSSGLNSPACPNDGNDSCLEDRTLKELIDGATGIDNEGNSSGLNPPDFPSVGRTSCPESSLAEPFDETFRGNNNRSGLQVEQCDETSRVDDGNRDLRPSTVPHGKKSVLELVRLALSSVQAAGKIERLSRFPPPPTDTTHHEDSSPSLQSEVEEENGLVDLGEQLYELFSGRSVHSDENIISCDDNGGRRGEICTSSTVASSINAVDKGSRKQRTKKGRQASDDSGYIPLSELGLPPTLCALVRGLLDSKHIGGEQVVYGSIREVEEDLRLMVSEPAKFLFRAIDTTAVAANGQYQIAPRNLYGREEETEKLMEAFKRATDPGGVQASKELVLISGYSGTGKSALVWSAQDQFLLKGACFVSGKFDSMQQLRPLSAFVSAVDEYCSLLASDDDRSGVVRKAIRDAIASDERAVLACLIPNFAKVFGTAKEDATSNRVQGQDALQRLSFMIRSLFQATCSRAHPVVLFLDDLQFADETSLMLMRALLSGTAIEGLMLIGCYRINEVGEDHPLTNCVSKIRRLPRASITTLNLGHLGIDDINALLSDNTGLTPRMTRSLANVVLQKTGGNALFVVQFLVSLQDEGLFHFSLASRSWEWDINRIRNKVIADGVVELMTAKFRKMGPEVIKTLRVAALFGAEIQEELFRIIDRASEGGAGITVAALDVAVKEGIMNKKRSTYKFAHDQIQQAAYFLIPESERKFIHLSIGRLLWKLCTAEETETYLFVIVDQLYRGASLLTEEKEKVMLARLSLVAGEMATNLSSFLPASAYLKSGVSLLSEGDWQDNRELCFDLYNMCAETESILGDFKSMQNHLDAILVKGETLEEKLRAYYVLIQSYGARGHTIDAINAAIAVINQLGENFPIAITDAMVKKEIGMTMQMLSAQDEESLLNLKTMNGAEKTVMKFLHALLYHIFMGKRSHFPVPVCRMVRLSVVHGVCRESALGFASYGAIQVGALGNVDEGYRYAKLALAIIERFQATEQVAKVYCTIYAVIYPFKEPVQSSLPPLKRACEAGLASGDTEHAMIAAHIHMATSFGSGQNLSKLWEDIKIYSQQMMAYNQHRVRLHCAPLRQAVLNLLGHSQNPTEMVGGIMNEENYDTSNVDTSFALFNNSNRMWLQYMFGELSAAWDTRNTHIKGNENMMSTVIPLWCYNILYSCLIALALARTHGEGAYSETIGQTMAIMTTWASSSHWNFQNKLELMKAEYAYLKGDFSLAEKCYSVSVELATSHRFIHEKALALERCGIFYLETGNHHEGQSKFTQARDCYLKWGAQSKVAHVEKTYL